jgi:hypothetical protein
MDINEVGGVQPRSSSPSGMGGESSFPLHDRNASISTRVGTQEPSSKPLTIVERALQNSKDLQKKSGGESAISTAALNSPLLACNSVHEKLALLEKWAAHGLYWAVTMRSVIATLEGYMNMAGFIFLFCLIFFFLLNDPEVRYLQARVKETTAFWLEAKNSFQKLFMFGPTMLLPRYVIFMLLLLVVDMDIFV